MINFFIRQNKPEPKQEPEPNWFWKYILGRPNDARKRR
jgi:hypothetical protein